MARQTSRLGFPDPARLPFTNLSLGCHPTPASCQSQETDAKVVGQAQIVLSALLERDPALASPQDKQVPRCLPLRDQPGAIQSQATYN